MSIVQRLHLVVCKQLQVLGAASTSQEHFNVGVGSCNTLLLHLVHLLLLLLGAFTAGTLVSLRGLVLWQHDEEDRQEKGKVEEDRQKDRREEDMRREGRKEKERGPDNPDNSGTGRSKGRAQTQPKGGRPVRQTKSGIFRGPSPAGVVPPSPSLLPIDEALRLLQESAMQLDL